MEKAKKFGVIFIVVCLAIFVIQTPEQAKSGLDGIFGIFEWGAETIGRIVNAFTGPGAG